MEPSFWYSHAKCIQENTIRAVVLITESGTPLALLSLLTDSRMNISQVDEYLGEHRDKEQGLMGPKDEL